jgi:hypothetical protein
MGAEGLICSCSWLACLYTDEKEKKFFLIYKEIQMGAVAKSSRRKGFLIYEEMGKYLVIHGRPLVILLIYDFATAPFWISLYMRQNCFLFYQCMPRQLSGFES